MKFKLDDGKQLKSFLVPIAREGWVFIALFTIGTLFLFFAAQPLGWLGIIATLWCIYFFRNPNRVTPQRMGLVVTPADGMVQSIIETPPPKQLEMALEPVTRISIFMNVFDCHVNRVPSDSRIGKLVYVPGRFVNAAFDKASDDNERQLIRFDLEDGRYLAAVQIAGLIARRIVCYLRENQSVVAGERFGLIRFGSRVDVYLPSKVKPLVIVGQRCIAGETVLADLDSNEAARQGKIR